MAAGQAEGGRAGVAERAGQAEGSLGAAEGVDGSQRGMEEISRSGESCALSSGMDGRSTGQVAGAVAGAALEEKGHIAETGMRYAGERKLNAFLLVASWSWTGL